MTDNSVRDVGLWLWIWKKAKSYRQFLDAVQEQHPEVTDIYVKAADGPRWMSSFDSSPLAIESEKDLSTLVQDADIRGLKTWAWAVPHPEEIDEQAALYKKICRGTGVAGLILDVEPFKHFWPSHNPVRLSKASEAFLKAAAGTTLALTYDPRPWNVQNYIGAWTVNANVLMPQCYWPSMGLPVETIMKYAASSVERDSDQLRRPVLPIDADPVKLKSAIGSCPDGYSLWRWGM